jgi:hypothetical protein
MTRPFNANKSMGISGGLYAAVKKKRKTEGRKERKKERKKKGRVKKRKVSQFERSINEEAAKSRHFSSESAPLSREIGDRFAGAGAGAGRR